MTVWCWVPLYNKRNQLYVHIYPLPHGPPSVTPPSHPSRSPSYITETLYHTSAFTRESLCNINSAFKYTLEMHSPNNYIKTLWHHTVHQIDGQKKAIRKGVYPVLNFLLFISSPFSPPFTPLLSLFFSNNSGMKIAISARNLKYAM